MKTFAVVLVILSGFIASAQSEEQDATKLEDQYKTCARHSIPAEKCTEEIYRQLREKDNPSLDPVAKEALAAAITYRTMLKNPTSMVLHSATVVDFNLRKDAYHVICLVVAGQNGFGGMTERGVAYVTYGHDGKTKSMWTENESGFGRTYDNMCLKPRAFRDNEPRAGVDVTDKVSQALKVQ
jgi:hypothetical protein